MIIIGCVLLASLGSALDAMTLGEDVAASLGIDRNMVRRRVVLGAALAVGAATSITGVIAFVGLVVPHLLRRVTGHVPSRLLLPSALGGASLVLLADVLTRLLSPVADIRIGVLTAVLGAPFFLWLVVRLRDEPLS